MKTRFIKTAQSFGLSARRAGALWAQLEVWKHSSGEEWTVNRLKRLKQVALGTVKVPESSGFLRGPWGQLVTDTRVSIRTRLTLVHIYLMFKTKEATPDQLTKFYGSLQGKPGKSFKKMVDSSVLSDWLSRFYRQRGYHDGGSPRYSSKYRWSKVKVINHGFSHHKSIPLCGFDDSPGLSEYHLATDISNFANSEPLMAWYNRWRGFLVKEFHTDDIDRWISASVTDETHDYVGDIQYIQEPGYKLRAIANPIRVAQWHLDPLKQFLMGQLQYLDPDCTHDQGKGIRKVQEQLQQGKTCYCFDLSDATNNIPYSLTREILKRSTEHLNQLSFLMDKSMSCFIELFDVMVGGEWSTPEGRSVRFTRGQPLGTGPSFALLALTHHAVMRYCGATDEQYVILGDDIAIFDKQIATRYVQVMVEKLEVPISRDKSIVSNTMAEFAGKVITSNSVTSKYRWDPIRTTNALEVLRYHGTRAVAWIPENLRSPALLVASLPRHLGGLGWVLPTRYKSLVDFNLRAKVLERVKEEPLFNYVSIQKRRSTVYHQMVDGHLVAPDWSIQYDYKGEHKKHPWYNVHYTIGVPVGAEDFYIRCSNPKALSSSSLIRLVQRLTV